MNILGMGVNAIEVGSVGFDKDEQRPDLVNNVPLTNIVIGNYQPRRKGRITKQSIDDLVQSIKAQGVLQPIIVRKMVNHNYELIAGERRYHAAIEANLKSIPCFIKEVDEKEALAIALIENIQREQLSVLEESEALLKLKVEHFLSVEDVAKLISKPRSTVANLIRVASLLSLKGKLLWEQGLVDYGHIRAVVILDHEWQDIILQYVSDHQLSVRETEKLIKDKKYYELGSEKQEKELLIKKELAEEVLDLRCKLSNLYQNPVKIKVLNSGKLRVSLDFIDLNSIHTFLNKIGQKE